MVKISYDTYNIYQAQEDPLAVILDGLVIDTGIAPRSYNSLTIAWERMTPIQRQLHGGALCKLFLGGESGKQMYEYLMTPPLWEISLPKDGRIKRVLKRVAEYFSIN